MVLFTHKTLKSGGTSAFHLLLHQSSLDNSSKTSQFKKKKGLGWVLLIICSLVISNIYSGNHRCMHNLWGHQLEGILQLYKTQWSFMITMEEIFLVLQEKRQTNKSSGVAKCTFWVLFFQVKNINKVVFQIGEWLCCPATTLNTAFKFTRLKTFIPSIPQCSLIPWVSPQSVVSP